MKIILLIIFLFPVIADGQHQQGIRFEKKMNLDQIKELAIKQRKWVFLDCYASWCGPCKFMDFVYKDKALGDSINRYFLSVKIPFDSAAVHDSISKKLFEDSKLLKENFNISAYPTYLFLDPTGNAVHQYSGAMNASAFLQLSVNARTPLRQYIKIKSKIKDYVSDNNVLRYVGNIAKIIGDTSFANYCTRIYFSNINNKKSDLTKQDIAFILNHTHLIGPRDFLFKQFFQQPSLMDSLAGQKGTSQGIVLDVLNRAIITPLLAELKDRNQPDWVDIQRHLVEYGRKISFLAINTAQINWFYKNHQWEKLASAFIVKYQNTNIDTTVFGAASINNFIWDVFVEHRVSSKNVRSALKIQNRLITAFAKNANYYDTYASLWYKLNRRQKAIFWEKVAVEVDSANAASLNMKANLGFSKTLQQMKSNSYATGK